MKLKVDQVKEARRAARTVIGEPSRSRKRGPHRVARRLKTNEWTEEEADEHEKDVDTQDDFS